MARSFECRNQSGPIRAFALRGRFKPSPTAENIFSGSRAKLGPDIELTSQTTSTISLVKEIEGDSYTVTARSAESSNGALVAVEFVAMPD